VEEKQENKIIVGTSADYPPFEYVDENQNISTRIGKCPSLFGTKQLSVEPNFS